MCVDVPVLLLRECCPLCVLHPYHFARYIMCSARMVVHLGFLQVFLSNRSIGQHVALYRSHVVTEETVFIQHVV